MRKLIISVVLVSVILIGALYKPALTQPIPTGFDPTAVRHGDTLTGGVTATFESDGSTAVTLNLTAQSITLGTHTDGNYVAAIADGTGIDGTANGEGTTYTPTFDPTELDALTWSDNANASNAWTFDVSGTDHTMTAGNALMTFSGGLTTTLDLIVTGGDITLGTTSIFSGSDTASLNNIDALNATTETTIEAAIDTLANLTSIGTIATGVWQGTAIAHEYGGLEADVSGYTNGIYGMASGSTLDIDTIAEIETAIGGSTNILTEAEIDASSELLALMDDETGTGLLVFATAPTFTTSIKITGADADPGAAGVIVYDNSITGIMDGGGLRWYDDDSIRLLVDLETDPTDDDYVVAYDSTADGFYMKADADSGGSTAYDSIGNPTGAGSIGFDDTETATYTTVQDTAGSFISFINSNADVSNQVYMLDLDYSADTTQDNADFIRLQDAGSTLIVFEEEGKITMTPSGVDDTIIISIIPSTALTQADAFWCGIQIDGDALDPGDVDNVVLGIDIDLSGVDLTNIPYVEALELIMPTGGVALHIEEGKIKQGFTSGGDAGAEYTAIDMFMDASSQAANSETHAIDVAVVGGDPDGLVVALGTHTYVAPVHQHIGTFSTPDQAGADSEAGFYDDSGTDYIDGVDGIEQFTADDDAIWISAATVFTEIEVIMGTPATRSITPTFWYWKDLGEDAWTEFFPADDTDGFQQSGTIRFETSAVTDWLSADVVNISAGDAGEAAAGYWIAIIRTVNADPGTPTPTTVKTGSITEYFWDETGAIDVLSVEADTITEGGNAVISEAVATAALIFGDSSPDADGEIAFDTTGDGSTVTAGVIDVHDGTEVVHYFGSAGYPGADNYIMKYDAGTHKVVWEADADSGGTTAWDDITDPDAAVTIDFVTYTQTIDIGKSDSGGGEGLILDVTDLGNGSDDVIVLKITTVNNDDANYIPIAVYDDDEGDSDLLFQVTSAGVKAETLTLTGDTSDKALILNEGCEIYQGFDGQVWFAEAGDFFNILFDESDISLEYTDGALKLRNYEDGIDGIVQIEGKDGGEKGILRVMSDGDDNYIELHHDDTDGHIITDTGDIHIEPAGGDVSFAASNLDTTGAVDFGGAASVEITNGTDPDVDAVGEISIDSDGANEPNDVVLRTIDGGGTQVALAQEQKSIQCTIIKPNDLADTTRDACPIWSNETGMTFVITKIEAWSDTDDTTVNVEVVDSDGTGSNATVDALEIATGSGPYTVTETTITAANITANRMIFLDFDDTDDPGWVKISICGYFLADVD